MLTRNYYWRNSEGISALLTAESSLTSPIKPFKCEKVYKIYVKFVKTQNTRKYVNQIKSIEHWNRK